jgi:hypothetical protein
MKYIEKIIEKIDLKTLLIIGLIIIIFLLRACSGGNSGGDGKTVKIDGKKYVVVKHQIDTVYREVSQTVYREGKTIFKDKPIYVPVPKDIDTNEILKDYYTKYIYKDTLKLKDSLGYITITDTIFKNNIHFRIWNAKINQMTIKETIFLKDPPKVQIFAGGVIGVDNINIINFAGPSLVLKDKKDHLYSLGVGYSNAKSVSVQGGMFWKISLRKNKK